MEVYDKYKVRFDGIKKRLLEPRHFLLLETDANTFVGLRVVRQHLSQIMYNFEVEIDSFLPLNPVSITQGTTLTQSFFSPHNTLAISQLSGVSDWLQVPSPRTNNLMQVFYGISPSYVAIAPEQPGGTYLDQLPTSSLNPSSSFYWLWNNSGWNSPLYEPSEETEFFVPSNLSTQFTLINTAPIIVNPKMLFIVNNLIVEPISDLATFQDILRGKIPSEKRDVGQIYSTTSAQWSPSNYSGVNPVSAKSILGPNAATAFKDAGYGK